MTDFSKIQMSSKAASLKILAEGTGSLIVLSATAGNPQSTTNEVFHNYGSNNLLWQVGFTIIFSGGGTTTGLLTPWVSGDGQETVIATIDSTNLYITGKAQTAGSATLSYTVNYSYRILVP